MSFALYFVRPSEIDGSVRVDDEEARCSLAEFGHDAMCRSISREEAEEIVADPDTHEEVRAIFNTMLAKYPNAEDLYWNYSY
jgi:hypothetical protein